MKFTAVIEIPKGSDRRIHMKNDGSRFEDFGPIKERIPVNNGVMPIHYGYIENTKNKIEGDHVDVIIFSEKDYQTGDKTEVDIIGLLNREDGDHKVIAIDDTSVITGYSNIPSPIKELII